MIDQIAQMTGADKGDLESLFGRVVRQMAADGVTPEMFEQNAEALGAAYVADDMRKQEIFRVKYHQLRCNEAASERFQLAMLGMIRKTTEAAR